MKPLLSGKVDVKNLGALNFPLFASPKIDGIRCLSQNGGVSRTLKPIPNINIREMFKEADLAKFNLDGELISGENFQETTSMVMSDNKQGDFTYYVFDIVNPNQTFDHRFKTLTLLKEQGNFPQWVKVVPHKIIYNVKELEAYEIKCLEEGHEGIMLRAPGGEYKFGRSTDKEGILLKMKRFVDDEATIIGFEPLMKNTNEATTDALGHSHRSSKKEGKVEQDTLGKFICLWRGKELKIGSGQGLTAELRKEIWNNKKKYMGKIVKFKYQDYGIVELPRIPIFIGFRDKRDM
jgi:DNA ligase-1